jgi:hypothetical protein
MIRIHKHGLQATLNSELTGWAVQSTRDGLADVAGGFIPQAERARLFAGGKEACEAFLRARLDEAVVS